MNDFIKDTYFTMPEDGMGWAILILMWLITLGALWLVGSGILYLIDSLFLPLQHGYGIVDGKFFEEAHYDTIWVYNAATKTSMPQTIYHPDAWRIDIIYGGRSGSIYLSSADYLRVKFGSNILMDFKMGRIWGNSLYVKNIYL